MPHYLITPVPNRSPRATHTRDSDGAAVAIMDIEGKITQGDPSRLPTSLAGYTAIVPPAPAVPVPKEIKNWQARAVLETAGALAAVESALAALPGDEGIVVRAAWAGGEPLKHDGQTVAAIAAALSFTTAQVDAWFVQADSLSVP